MIIPQGEIIKSSHIHHKHLAIKLLELYVHCTRHSLILLRKKRSWRFIIVWAFLNYVFRSKLLFVPIGVQLIERSCQIDQLLFIRFLCQR